MRTDLFDYALPPELIAQTPVPRGESRLLVLHRSNGHIEHRRFADLPDYLAPGDTLVLNDTRVIARRLVGQLESGRAAEILLLRPVGERRWAALVKPGRSLRAGKEIVLFGPQTEFSADVSAESPAAVSSVSTANSLPDGFLSERARVVGATAEGGRLLEFATPEARDRIGAWGSSPLPPYIHANLPTTEEERYQTIYARHNGSAAAPTAGLHFTPEILARAQEQGVACAMVTLHVGVDTFRPVKAEDTDAHEMHGEWLAVSPEAARIINATPGRVIAVGTTSVRALESAARQAADARATPGDEQETNSALAVSNIEQEQAEVSDRPNAVTDRRNRLAPFSGETRLFITPGYRFRATDALLTNFHLPRSTLLMLISALAGRDAVLNAYAAAVQERYRFYSFGDAMLII